jgi:phosphoribosylformylglycinamidine cyclo-ligase
MTETYKKSGVDIDAGNSFIEKIIPHIKKTPQRGVISHLGGYAAHYALDISDMPEPVLVSGTDGVGTKLKIAIDLGVLNTIGIDLVAMCVNDISCSGAKPLFFLDYFATSKLDPSLHEHIVEGISRGCILAGCGLVGGETAEMPDFYSPGDFDLAGFAVGAVNRSKIIDGSEIRAGNAIIGLHSSGLHSNGFSLVRKVIKDAGLELGQTYDGLPETLGEVLLRPTIIYSQLLQKLGNIYKINGIAHITGGGFWDNLPRILPNGLKTVISKSSWEMPEIFNFIRKHSGMDEEELFRVFNCGIGMILVVPETQAEEIANAASTNGYPASVIGKIAIMRAGETQAVVLE